MLNAKSLRAGSRCGSVPGQKFGSHSPCAPRVQRAVLHAGASRPQCTCRSTAAGGNQLWTPGEGGMSPMAATAVKLQSFCEAFPELPDQLQAAMAMNLPGLLDQDQGHVRTKLQQLSEEMGLPLPTTAALVAKAPLLWNRSVQAAAQKVEALATELEVSSAAAVALLCSQPSLAAINMPGLVKDKVAALATALGVTDGQAVDMVGAQPMLWVIPPRDVRCTASKAATVLGCSVEVARQLITRMPVLLACDPAWLKLSISGLCSTAGVSEEAVLELLVRCLGVVTLDTSLLASALSELSSDLEVDPEEALQLLIHQPALLVTQRANLAGAMDVLSDSLQLPTAQALQLLVAQPALLYDVTPELLGQRLDTLAALFGCSREEARELALQQPSLLVVAASPLKSAVDHFISEAGLGPGEVAQLFQEDPGAALVMGHLEAGGGGVLESWSSRLDMAPQVVSALISQQPGLLEMSPNTLKARLQSLAALLDLPAVAAAQLVVKHPALAAIPPNVTITKAKQMSLKMRVSINRAAELMAKVPPVLLVPPAELAGPVAEQLLDVTATYEFYTGQWLMAAAKEKQPSRQTSFATMHGS